MIWPSGLCDAKIKISLLVSSNMTQIECHKDSPDHTHTLRESDRLKCPEVIQSLVKKEVIKSYPPVAIVNAIKEHATDHLNLSTCVKDLC